MDLVTFATRICKCLDVRILVGKSSSVLLDAPSLD